LNYVSVMQLLEMSCVIWTAENLNVFLCIPLSLLCSGEGGTLFCDGDCIGRIMPACDTEVSRYISNKYVIGFNLKVVLCCVSNCVK